MISSNRPARGRALLLVSILLLITPSRAILKEQAGQYDWLKQNVGDVKIARFVEGRVVVASTAGVVAALEAADGSVAWRVLLDEGKDVQALETAGEITLSLDSAHQIRAFGPQGQLLWEHSSGEDGCTSQPGIATAGVAEVVYVACGASVFAYDAKLGHRKWRASIAEGNAAGGAAAVSSGGDAATVTAATVDSSGSKLQMATLDASTGEVLSSQTVSGSSLDATSLVALGQGAAAVLASGGKQACAVTLAAGGAPQMRCVATKDLLPPGVADAEQLVLRSEGCGNAAVLRAAGGSAALSLEGGVLRRVAGGASVGVGCSADAGTALTAAMKDAGLHLAAVAFSSAAAASTKLYDATIPDLRRATVTGALLEATVAFVGSSGQALVQLKEGSLAFFPGNKGRDATAGAPTTPAWVRAEALAGITDHLFADLPAPTAEIEAQWAAIQPTLSESLSVQLLALKAQVGLASPAEVAEVESHRAMTSDRLRPTRDPDGFRRQLIVATKAGKVAALHTGDGRVLWSLDFGPAAAPQRLAPWRTPHDLREDALIVAFHASDGETRQSGGKITATVINAHTGTVVGTDAAAMAPGGVAADVVQLPQPVHDGKADAHVFAAVGPAGVTVLPRTASAKAAFEAQAPHLVRWRVSVDGTQLLGTRFAADATKEEFTAWSVTPAPPGSGLKILSVAARDPDEAIYSAARPIPGGNVLLKHLSPNTLLVVAGPPAGAPPPLDTKIVATLLDAATGRVLMTQSHASGTGPVHSIVSEHWAAYHFWGADIQRWQVAVVDGYHPAPPQLHVLDLALGRAAAANATADALNAGAGLFFERQVFTTRLPAAALAVTKTAHGTAAKTLLVGTPGGQVYMVDRRLLDPRRPVIVPGTKPTPAQTAEALPPYQSDLRVMGPMYATLDKRVGRLSAVSATPAVLESASLMVARGLDLFYSRLQPSKGFDMVPDDFPRALLVAMVAGMALALVALRAMLSQRALKAKWQ